jgi:hypothetical protein
MLSKILQWNILKAWFEFIEKLHQDHRPCMLCLQETNFKANELINIKCFNVAHRNRTNSPIASDEVAIHLKQNINCTEILLNTNIKAIAILV